MTFKYHMDRVCVISDKIEFGDKWKFDPCRIKYFSHHGTNGTNAMHGEMEEMI